MSNKSVSIIVPAFNCEKVISQTIEAILSQDYQGEVELIVVDDGSTDQTAKIIQKNKLVRYVAQENQGPAVARNRGAKEARFDLLAFTDSDCVPQKNWLKTLIAGFSDSQIGAVAGSYGIANPENLLAFCIQKEIEFRHHQLMPDFPKYFGSFNFCVKREVFESIGGFDTGYRFASGEDNDLSYKIIKNGQKIYFERNALVNHHHTEKISKYLKEQFRHGYWRAKLYATHPEMTKGDDYTYWKDIVEVPLVLAILFPTGLFWINSPLLVSTASYALLLLLLLEFGTAFQLTRTLKKTLFFGFVLTLRSWARTLGLLPGLFHFVKKNK